jgi:hypothetical protein
MSPSEHRVSTFASGRPRATFLDAHALRGGRTGTRSGVGARPGTMRNRSRSSRITGHVAPERAPFGQQGPSHHGCRQLDVRGPGLGGRAAVQVRDYRRPARVGPPQLCDPAVRPAFGDHPAWPINSHRKPGSGLRPPTADACPASKVASSHRGPQPPASACPHNRCPGPSVRCAR